MYLFFLNIQLLLKISKKKHVILNSTNLTISKGYKEMSNIAVIELCFRTACFFVDLVQVLRIVRKFMANDHSNRFMQFVSIYGYGHVDIALQ